MSKPYPVRATGPDLKRILLATAAILALGAQASGAFAQEATGNEVDAVVVTGFRKSLSDARNIKRDSVIQKDAIVAEDMAKFPELNLAESLQRLPGVQINREAGEGRRISLRGLGPDFARVQLNGMEVLGNVDSAQDSRGQRSRDRAFDFNIFASELFSKVEVEKTFEAAQNEGGMAGTVGLFTGKPFDYKSGSKGALSVKLGTNEYTEDAQPRVAALFSHNWDDKFGVLVSVAYGKRETTEQGHNTYNYSKPGASTLAGLVTKGLDISKLSAAQQAKFLSGDLYFADGNRISSWNAKMERLGVTAAVQWRPVDNLLLTLDALHGEFTTHRDELHLATRPLASTGSVAFDTAASSIWPAAFRKSAVINNLAWDKSNYVTMTDVTGTTFGSEHRRSLNENRFDQLALTGKWDVSEQLTIDGHVGYEKSTYKTPYDDKLYMRAKGNLVANYGADGQSANFSYPGWDPTNPANYAMDSFYYRGFNNESGLREGVLNARYELTDALTLRAGVAYHRFSQDGIELFYDDNVNGTRSKARGTSVADITSVFTNNFGSWLIGDYAKAFAKYNEYHRFGPNKDGTGGALQDIENVYKTTEETVSEYVQMDWDSDLFGKRFRGNVGLRGYSTDTHSTGWIQGDSYAYLGTADVEGSYSGVLPALNTVLELTPEVLVRFSATQNLNRPGLGSMAAKGSAFQNSDSGEITASRGNPNLKPYKDTTLDLSVEYYFGKVGLLSASVFQKTIKNYIGSQTLEDIPFSQTGVPFTTIPGATASTIVSEFSMPINVAGKNKLTGLELVAQSQFTFLPAPFDNFGAVANYTYVDADQALTGVSKTSYNATIYYETDHWGARGSLSHRDRWFSGHSDSLMSASTRGFQAGTYFDASAFYNFNDQLQFTLNAINLTNQKDTQFWGQNEYLYNQTQSGTTYMVGLSYKF
ncbi:MULTISPECIES: TonB-dependent receptor [unclassified Caulobacter]|uniref:TonB-dependent receptor n=1 Tax=unclassified Caulobacter TaxID=2648921 RepID=UPI000D3C5FCC|nr:MULTISPECIES: TonB-dependent receptor [unclassified Caulobacter]PTS87882.1 TonB-dependent receptor [Caulobacter sp. HMWF009]PTT06572.1 TonB-dependent receptor [Caulobacter sp. HMWF025]PTT79053.1 TonB-dependent receptor [Pseudomonas sp. HMWF010]